MLWKRLHLPFDRGSYCYSGNEDITEPIHELLTLEEMDWIRNDLKNYIAQKKKNKESGADYHQIYFQEKTGHRIVIIDNKSLDELQDMRDEGLDEDHVQTENYHRWILQPNKKN